MKTLKAMWIEGYINVLKKYAVFSGRARREEYWTFIVFHIITALTLNVLTIVPAVGKIFWFILAGYFLVSLIPFFAIAVRRLHDTNRSGLFLFLILIPLIGIIILLIFLIQKGSIGENKYGKNPKDVQNGNLSHEGKNKRLIVSFLIISAIFLWMSFYYVAFNNFANKEFFSILNTSSNKYYLNVVADKDISPFSLKSYEQINGVKYFYICESGRYELKGSKMIFQCKRNDDIDLISKMDNIFSEFKIEDENNNIIWNLKDKNTENVFKMEEEIFTKSVFWDLIIPSYKCKQQSE